MLKKVYFVLCCIVLFLATSAFSKSLSYAEITKKSDVYFEQGKFQQAIDYLQSQIVASNLSEWDKIQITLKAVRYIEKMKDSKEAIHIIYPVYKQFRTIYHRDNKSFILGKSLIRTYGRNKQIDLALVIAKENYSNAPTVYFRAIALTDLGKLFSDKGDNKKAIAYYYMALKKIQKINKNGRYNDLKGSILYDIALCLDEDGQNQKAIRLLTKLMTWQKNKKLHYGKTAILMGLIEISRGHYDKAYSLFEQASQDYKEYDKPAYIKAENFLGVMSQNYGHFDRARQHYLIAFSAADKANLLEWQVQTQNNLGSLATSAHQFTKAHVYLQRALELNKKYNSIEKQISIYHNLALLADAQKQYNKANQYYSKVIGMLKHSKDKDGYAQALVNLAISYQNAKQFEKVEQLYIKAIDVLDKASSKGETMAKAMTNLATFYVLTKQYQKAEPLFKDAIDIQLKILGVQHPDLAYSYNNLAHLYSLQNKDKLAAAYYKKAVAIAAGSDNDTDTWLYRKNMLLSTLNSKVREHRFRPPQQLRY